MSLLRFSFAVLVYAATIAIAYTQTPFDRLLQDLKPDGHVTDAAKVLSGVQKKQLEELLADLERATTVEIAVVTLPSLQGGEISDFANRLFERWGIGKRGKDNGILLLAAVEDRKVWIEVGYGLESLIPDARAGRVLDESVIPFFRQRQIGQGLVEGATELSRIVAANAQVKLGTLPPPAPAVREPSPITSLLCPVLFLVVLVLMFRKNPLLLGMLLAGGNMRGRRSHRHFGGGGFGGSGGFGGGGFGGFGGGSSGGGGAGRSW